MIETLEGVENAREIARLPGVTGLFAASGDLGNFSGYRQGDPEYEAIISEIATAAREAGIHLCGPLRWADRPGFDCFQAGTEGANIRRGAQAEIERALEQFNGRDESAGDSEEANASVLVADLTAQCGTIVYEADCLASVNRAAAGAAVLSEAQRDEVLAALRRIAANSPSVAGQISEIVTGAGLSLEP